MDIDHVAQNPVIPSVTQSSSVRGNNIFGIFCGNAGKYELAISKSVYSVATGSPAVNGVYGQICSFLYNYPEYGVC
jgi:hypothetical protein